MRVAFLGLPLAAVLLAKDGHEIVYVGACRRAPGLQRLRARMAADRVHLRPELGDPLVLAKLASLAPEMLVSWFWTTKLPPAVLALAPAIGVHPSLLPRHRGPDPYFWAIDEGDAVTGVTAHRLEPEYDTGAVIGHRAIAVLPEWNAWQLARALDRPSLALLREVVRAFARGEAPLAHPQDERLATEAPAPTDPELAICWAWDAERIARRVRAAAPYPGAWTELGDRMVSLVRVRVTRSYPRALSVAEAGVRADGIAVVRAGEDAVELLEGRDDESEVPLSSLDLAEMIREARGRF